MQDVIGSCGGRGEGIEEAPKGHLQQVPLSVTGPFPHAFFSVPSPTDESLQPRQLKQHAYSYTANQKQIKNPGLFPAQYINNKIVFVKIN